MRRVAIRVPGFRAGGVHCGIKDEGLDLALVVSDVPAAVAGVFTRSTVVGAPVELCRERVLQVDRGNGTIVAEGNSTIPISERKKAVAALLREAAVQAIHLDIPPEQTHALLEKEYQAILAEKKRSPHHE